MELIEKTCQCWFDVCVSSLRFVLLISQQSIVLLAQYNIYFISLRAKKYCFDFVLFPEPPGRAFKEVCDDECA
jgi:hypothetical protein